jgi:hypothetical protein
MPEAARSCPQSPGALAEGECGIAPLKRSSPLGTIIVLMALAVGVMLWAEGSPDRTIRLSAPWTAGELSTYTLVRYSGASGVSSVNGVDATNASDGADDATAPAIGSAELGVVNRGEHVALTFDYHDQGLSERSETTADAATLQPVSSIIRRESPQSGPATITTRYSPAGATPGSSRPVAHIEITSSRGDESVTRELPERVYYDADQMLHLLRAMPLKQRFSATFNALDTLGASPVSARVRVVGRETVRVPAGEFDCWRIDVQGLSMRAWVAVAPPSQLVIFELITRGTRALLTDYAPGGGV